MAGRDATLPEALDLNNLVALPPEKQALTLLQWLADCEVFLARASPDVVSRQQQTVQQALINLLALPTPPIGRVLRSCMGRCFHLLFDKGDRKVLFDTVSILIQKVAVVRTDKEVKQKHATVYALGAVLDVAGDSVLQLIPEAVSALTKTIRTSSLDTGIRALALDSLKMAISKPGQVKDDAIMKDLIRISRSGLADKHCIVQIRAAELLEQTVTLFSLFNSQSDIESTRSPIVQSMDTSSKRLRFASANALSSLYLSVLSDKAVDALADAQITEPKKKRASTIKNDTDEPDGRGSPVPSKSATIPPFRIDFREILRQLSTLYSRSSSKHVRSSVIQTYSIILKRLGAEFAKINYSIVLEHLLKQISIHPLVVTDRYRSIETRAHIQFLLGHVIRRQLLDEPGKMTAIRVLAQMLDQKSDSKGNKADGMPIEATISAITELSGLVQDLGSAVSFEQDVLVETFKKYIQHPNSAVQVVSSWGLRLFVLAVPSQLESLLCWSKLEMEKHLALLNDSNTSNTRVPLGLAQSIAVIIQASTYRPMYFANDNAIAVWKFANTQLQLSAKSDLRSSQIQIQIAWNFIGALMSIGMPFVKSQVGQLLLLWHNALPRPLPRDKMATSNVAELHYLLHVRDRALAALSLFLQYNIKILTHDLSTRIHGMLSDTATFVGRLPPAPAIEDSRLLSAHAQLVDIAVRVKMRVFKCYSQLVGQDFRKIASPEILMNAIAVFVETDPLISKSPSLKSPVGSSFESLSLVTDNFAFGVTSHQSSQPPKFHTGEEPCSAKRDSDEEVLDRMVGMSVLGSLENDVSQIYGYGSQITEIPLPVPSPTALVDSAIDLFSLMVFDQPLKIQESAFAQIAASLGEPLLVRNPGRKAAITKNVAIAISKALNGMNNRLAREIGHSVRVKTLLLDVLKNFILDSDREVRKIAGDAFGRVCSNLQDADISKQVKFLTDSVISNREPNSRAGFAFALGSFLYHLGGMAAGVHLRNVLGLLLSLANDSHPTVHFWALEALENCIESSGLGFSSHVASCLGILARLILSDGFDPEDVASGLSNAALDVSTLSTLTRCIDAIINVLGPDLTSSKKSKVLICSLVNELDLDCDPFVSIEAVRCMQHLELFAPDTVDHVRYVNSLEANLSSDSQHIRHISSEALYAMVRKDVDTVFKLSRSPLSDQLWSSIYSHGCMSAEVEDIIYSWLDQTALKDVKQWIGLCLKLLTHSGQRELAKEDVKGETSVPEQPEFIDEAAAFSTQSPNKIHVDEGPSNYMSWQTVSFALGCLRRVVQLNLKTLSVDSSTHPLILCVGDLIRAAFTASTSTVVEIRLGGLKLLHDLIKGLAECLDPDFPESTLLEQYQAQIASALTPAFAADSSPDIAAEAISICAEFISSGIVKDVDHMGRLLKILVAGLLNVDDESFIGELKVPNTNARLMVKISVLSAWAELQIQSKYKPYLFDIVSEHLERLAVMWLDALTVYAKVQFEPEVGDGNLIDEMILDSQLGSSREFLLQVYRPCWIHIMLAVATLIEMESDVIFTALDSSVSEAQSDGTNSNYRGEPVAFFFIIYGLCFQTLLKMINRDDAESKRIIPIVLDGLKKFLRPSISGNAIYKGFVFAEMTDLLDRLVLMENADVQIAVVQITSSLAKNHPHSVNIGHQSSLTNGNHDSNVEESIRDEIEQLLDLVHILILALNKSIYMSTGITEASNCLGPDLAAQALTYLCEMTHLFPPAVRIDLLGGIFSTYQKLLDQGGVFSSSANLLLAPYKAFCRILREYLTYDEVVAPRIINSVKYFTSRLVNRLDTLGPSQLQEYETGCFLVTVSFTSIPDAFLGDVGLFSRFSSVLASGLLQAKMSTCAMKCLKALLSSDQRLPRRWFYTIFADLLPQFTSNSTSAHLAARSVLAILVELIEKSPLLRSMALLLPALTQEADVRSEDSGSVADVAEAVVRLASLNPSSFRLVLGQMHGKQKEYLTELLREALVDKNEVEVEVEARPTISLTMDFGSIE